MADKIDLVLMEIKRCNAAELEDLCTKFKVIVPATKKGNQTALVNLMLRMMSSEDVEDLEDGGEELFRTIMEAVTEMKGVREIVTETVKVQTPAKELKTEAPETSEVPTSSKTKIELTKLREFKIVGGTIGSTDGGLEYLSLSYQIQEGKAAGYSQKEIMAGVIKAIKGGSSLRRYLEGRPNITEDNFMQVLRAHYNVKDSTTLFNEMANAAQEPTETEMNYVLRMMSLRDSVLTLSKEEACPFEENLVRRRFFHSISVGLRKDSIRLEAQNVLRDPNMADEVLLKEISNLVARESEHMKKTKGKGAVVGMVDVGEDKILKELGNLAESFKAMKGEMVELKRKMKNDEELETDDSRDFGGNVGRGYRGRGAGNYSRGRGYNRGYSSGPRYFVGKCEECQKTGSFCEHCSNCGEGGHKRRDCPKNT